MFYSIFVSDNFTLSDNSYEQRIRTTVRPSFFVG